MDMRAAYKQALSHYNYQQTQLCVFDFERVAASDHFYSNCSQSL
jgi:hypothetical protein